MRNYLFILMMLCAVTCPAQTKNVTAGRSNGVLPNGKIDMSKVQPVNDPNPTHNYPQKQWGMEPPPAKHPYMGTWTTEVLSNPNTGEELTIYMDFTTKKFNYKEFPPVQREYFSRGYMDYSSPIYEIYIVDARNIIQGNSIVRVKFSRHAYGRFLDDSYGKYKAGYCRNLKDFPLHILAVTIAGGTKSEQQRLAEYWTNPNNEYFQREQNWFRRLKFYLRPNQISSEPPRRIRLGDAEGYLKPAQKKVIPETDLAIGKVVFQNTQPDPEKPSQEQINAMLDGLTESVPETVIKQ